MTETPTAEQMLCAYAAGVFPMAAHRNSTQLHWMDPPKRGILPLDSFHVPKRLRRRLRRSLRADREVSVHCDRAFSQTVSLCKEIRDATREMALSRLHRALIEFVVDGRHNLASVRSPLRRKTLPYRRPSYLLVGEFGEKSGGARKQALVNT